MEDSTHGSTWIWKGKRYFLLLVVQMKLSVVVPSIVSVFAIIGGLYAFDLNYTRASTTKSLEAILCDKDKEILVELAGQRQRLNQYILQDRRDWLEQRKYRLLDLYQNRQMPQVVKEEYRTIESEMKKIDKQLRR
jgi:hypothetical protein